MKSDRRCFETSGGVTLKQVWTDALGADHCVGSRCEQDHRGHNELNDETLGVMCRFFHPGAKNKRWDSQVRKATVTESFLHQGPLDWHLHYKPPVAQSIIFFIFLRTRTRKELPPWGDATTLPPHRVSAAAVFWHITFTVYKTHQMLLDAARHQLVCTDLHSRVNSRLHPQCVVHLLQLSDPPPRPLRVSVYPHSIWSKEHTRRPRAELETRLNSWLHYWA